MMHHRKAWSIAAAVGSLVFGLVSAAAAADDIVIGGLFPTTGPSSAIGIMQQRGVEYAVALKNEQGGIRGRQVKVLYEDTQARPDRAILAFNKLTDLNEMPLMVVAYSGPILAVAPLATRKQVLLINASAQADILGDASPYLINTISLLRDETSVLSDFVLKDLKKKKAVILFENGPAGTAGRDDLKAAYSKAGGEIVSEESVPLGETNFRAVLLKVASLNPDVVFVVLTQNLKLFGEQAKQNQLAATIVGTNYFTDPDLVHSGFADGWYSTAIQINAPDSMTTDFKKRYDLEMGIFAREYFNAMQIVFKSIDGVLADNDKLTGESVRKKLFAIGKFEGLMPLEMKTNNASMPVSLVKIDNKTVTTLRQAQSQ